MNEDQTCEATTNEAEAVDRALSVRLPIGQYRTVRTVAVTKDMTNAEVIAWAVELLDRYVQGGGER